MKLIVGNWREFVTTVKGACRCGNVRVSLELSREPSSYSPRVCDCDFCRQRGAAYFSDPAGSLSIGIERLSDVQRIRQGSMTAQFLVCRCGALVAVLYEGGGGCFAAVNARMLEHAGLLGADITVTPKSLSEDQKIERWTALWFARVEINSRP